MDIKKTLKLFEQYDDLDQAEDLIRGGQKKSNQNSHRKLSIVEKRFVSQQDDSRKNFTFTYKAARFEEWWLLDSLGHFYEHKWISDVLSRVKGGKEASVYQCRAGESVEDRYLAAKVYRPRSLRNLKNDHQYRTGRIELDADGHRVKGDRESRAISKRTDFGEELRHQSWISYEFQTLKLLHEKGVDVPRPYAVEKNAILMEYIGGPDSSAPALHSLSLDRDEAAELFDRAIRNIDLMLSCDRIHGDLSAYNILYWDGDITLIDFPQVVHPENNPQGWNIFQRDVSRVCEYFISQGVKCEPRKLAMDMWLSHGHKVVKDLDAKYLDPDNNTDREVWLHRNTD